VIWLGRFLVPKEEAPDLQIEKKQVHKQNDKCQPIELPCRAVHKARLGNPRGKRVTGERA
jgi:hypothetical protein